MKSNTDLYIESLLARIAELEAAGEALADIVQWAIDDMTFTYIKEGKEAIKKFEALKSIPFADLTATPDDDRAVEQGMKEGTGIV